MVREGNILWSFDGKEWTWMKYDDSSFYRRCFQSRAGDNKAVDIVAFEAGQRALWLIEAKDYRRNRRDPDKGPLWDEVAAKVRDTLAGLFAAAMNAEGSEKTFARRALTAAKIRVVLHLEQSKTPSKLFPQPFDPTDIQQKLRQVLKAVDAHPIVMSTATQWSHWSTTWKPRRSKSPRSR